MCEVESGELDDVLLSSVGLVCSCVVLELCFAVLFAVMCLCYSCVVLELCVVVL